uniref:Uncharacterized protein n=1 Tax=Parascaris univalens TaxID=6257 RepID=A0A915BJY6_PARUN
GNSLSNGRWSDDLSDTQGSCEELLKKVELKGHSSSPVAMTETSITGCRTEQQQTTGVHLDTAVSNVRAVAEGSITPDSGPRQPIERKTSSPLVQSTQEDSLGLDGQFSFLARQCDKSTAKGSNNSGSQALPTGAEIFDIQSIQEVATHDETLNNVVLQKLGCFPTCFQFTLLRLSAMALLITAWAIMIFFPCVYLEYNEIHSTNSLLYAFINRIIFVLVELTTLRMLLQKLL